MVTQLVYLKALGSDPSRSLVTDARIYIAFMSCVFFFCMTRLKHFGKALDIILRPAARIRLQSLFRDKDITDIRKDA